jgi:hypothetical protein
MSVLDDIRKLDEQKAALIESAKKEALDQANTAIATLNELGFSYHLTQGQNTPRQTIDPRIGASLRSAATGTRRTGIREQVLQAVTESDGISRSKLLEQMGAKGEKSAEQSISNALAALKKGGQIGLVDGNYRAA